MPAISAPATVLVTGANGHIGTHIIQILLDRGFTVRATVRDEKKGDYLRSLHPSQKDRVQYTLVPDVIAPGAYDEAVVDVDAIIHLAFPVSMGAKDVDAVLKPGVGGTTLLLETAVKLGNKVKRFVLCSSISAIFEPHEGPYTYSEADWNESSIATLKAQGTATGPLDLYNAGKTLQEKAVFEFAEKNKETLKFDVVAILPGFSVGPILANQAKGGSGSTWISFKSFTTTQPIEVFNIVDVRDVADAHALALTVPEASGGRFLITHRDFNWQEAWDVVHASDEPNASKVPVGKPGSAGPETRNIKFDVSRSTDILGVKYRPFEETVLDAWRGFVKMGWTEEDSA